MDMTIDVTLIKKCLSIETDTMCNEDCQWRHGKNATDNSTQGPPPLFTEDFCHPVNVSKDTALTVWKQCIDQSTKATCSISAGCNWSEGKELIPDHDFCAPMDLTKDIAIIQKCIEVQTATECNADCQWRHGKNSTNNTQGPQPLFSAVFCHPEKISQNFDVAEWTACNAATESSACTVM